MGMNIERTDFSEQDYQQFKHRLADQVVALERLLARPGFGEGEPSVGAELELFLIDAAGQPMPIGPDVEAAVDSPRVTPELDRFEIELATPPVPLAGRPFEALERSMARERALIDRAAADRGARTVAIGVLPTLRRRHLTARAITDLPRYRALTEGMRRMRQAPFAVAIDGDDPLEISSDHAALEGANTAFQVHLRVAPADFARVYNAAAMAAAPALAAAGNSPTFLGHRLWEETRVALFKQAGDVRPPDGPEDWRVPARINFGTGWLRDGAVDQFRESVAMHEPLLPLVGDEDALACVDAGGVPALTELRLHHGTVWYWNRAVYDPTGDGHLRLELRSLPAGPTGADMLANAAFLLGLILDLAPETSALLPAFPFDYAERNFYRAARHGLGADLLWPLETTSAPQPLPAAQLIPPLIERARRGLRGAGVAEDEVALRLDTFAARVQSGVTGAVWQRHTLAHAEQTRDRDAALATMLEQYVDHAATGRPVHVWPLERR
jgi:Glutamate-cysteine ligase family 2(GCS2)